MRKRLAVLLLSVVVGLTSCSRNRQFTANEYDVVSAYVTGLFAGHVGKEHASKIVILKMTSPGDDDLLPDENGHPVPSKKTAESCARKPPLFNKQRSTVSEKRTASKHFLVEPFGFLLSTKSLTRLNLTPFSIGRATFGVLTTSSTQVLRESGHCHGWGLMRTALRRSST